MKKLTYLFLALLIVTCSSDDSDNGGNEPSNCDVVYLADNGLTIKACDDAVVGDTGNINSFTYTIVSEQQLRDYIDADYPDLNRLVTSQVTNMQELFRYTDINQPIGNWDVSNVTNMVGMFLQSEFNEYIGNWDVSNVTDMEEMFYDNYYFNQDISSWSVDNVTNCSNFSGEAPLTEENTPNFTNCTP